MSIAATDLLAARRARREILKNGASFLEAKPKETAALGAALELELATKSK